MKMKILVQRVMGYFQQKPTIEIWTTRDNEWEDNKGILYQYTSEVLGRLRQRHPGLIIYHPKRTWQARNFEELQDWCRMLGGWGQAYVIPFLPNGVTMASLKQSCIQLEFGQDGQRLGDIDIYLANGKKINRNAEIRASPTAGGRVRSKR